MNKQNKKVSTPQVKGFYCCKCDKHEGVTRYKKAKHCTECEVRVVAANKLKKDNVVAVAKQVTIDARNIKKRAADLMYAIEHKKITGNHLVDYL